MTIVHFASGSACDLFLSLFVLHHAGEFGMRPASAAGIRQRLSPASREALEQFYSYASVPLQWISSLPSPQDAACALQTLEAMPPAERIPALARSDKALPGLADLLQAVARRCLWTPEDRASLVALFSDLSSPSPVGLDHLLNAFATLPETGEKLLAALQEYQNVFFAEEERRLQPILQRGLAEAQTLAARLQPVELVERLSRGVRLENPDALTDLTLLPSWWVAPLAFLSRPAEGRAFIAFSVRAALPAGAEGAEAPEDLVTALKALGDPTRLRILRYLARAPLSPSELARRLRLRPPTIIHHLRLLRFAGLVQITVSSSLEKRYAARLEALASIDTSLQDYLRSHG